MFLKKKKPTSSGSRHQVTPEKRLLSKEKPLNKLRERANYFAGRNNTGRITVRRKGGKGRFLSRVLSSYQNITKAVVLSAEYAPSKSALVHKAFDLDKKIFFYTLAINKVYPGCIIELSRESSLSLGYKKRIKDIPAGTIISNICTNSETKGQCARSAGSFGLILNKTSKIAQVKLPSGKRVKVSADNYATIGSISYSDHKQRVLGKAGRNRFLGKRPKVRGVAMNPVDHPHGGGEGKTSGGRPSVSPWAKPIRSSKKMKN